MNEIKFKNLVKLSGGAQSYKECSSKKISEIIHEFNDNKLKDRANKIIKRRNQAIAVALSQANAKCTYNSQEKKILIKKVNDELNSNKQLNLSNIIEIKKAIEILLSKGKHKQIYIFKKLLLDKVIKIHLLGETIDKNMWNEIKNINEIKN
jgi:hypothetical protein